MPIQPTPKHVSIPTPPKPHPIPTLPTPHPIPTPRTRPPSKRPADDTPSPKEAETQNDPPVSVRSPLVLRPFLLWLVLWLSGCLWGGYLSLSSMVWGICAIILICAALWAWWYSRPYTMLALCAAAFALGGLSPSLAAKRQSRTMDPLTPPLLAKRLFYEGVLLQPLQPRFVPPYRYPIPKRHLRHPVGICSHPAHPSERITTDQATHVGSAAFLLRRWSHDIHGPWMPIHEKILLQIVGDSAFSRGQWMRVSLKLSQPRRYANSGQSDPWQSLAADGIRYRASTAHDRIVRLASPDTSVWMASLDTIRQQARQWLQIHAKQIETRALFLALLLGDRSEITPQLREDFARTGTSHLLAISGLHLALVGGCFFGAWLWLLSQISWLLLYTRPRRIAALFTLPATYLYAFLSGPSVSTQRALIMINLYLFGVIFLRKTNGMISLFATASLILMWNPTAHTTPAFLLSFGSVFWLMTLGTHLQQTDISDAHNSASLRQRCARLLRIASKWVGLPMLSSFLVMLGTMPVSLEFSPHFPIHGPLVNLIAIPLCGFLSVALGLLALALSWICSPLAIGLLSIAEYCTGWLIVWVRFMASFPSVILQLPPLRTNETLALLSLLGSLAIFPYIPRLSLALVLSCPLLLSIPPTLSTLQQRLHPTLQVDFLDVGQGDAIFLRFPNQQTMLIDAGGEAFAPVDVGERAILPYLRHQRIHRLDYVVMSHPHPDHFGGFLTLFQQIPVGAFWHNQQRGGHPHYRNLREILRKQRIPQRSFSRPTTRYIGGVRIDILHPFPGPHEGDTYYWALHANDNSLVMLLTYGKTRLLLTGDIEERAEEILTERYPNLRADLLKVPHHASRTSSTSRLLDHIQPRHAFAGIGRQNLFGFPHATTLQRYKRRKIHLWRTDLHGMIRVRIDKRSFSIHPTLHETPIDPQTPTNAGKPPQDRQRHP